MHRLNMSFLKKLNLSIGKKKEEEYEEDVPEEDEEVENEEEGEEEEEAGEVPISKMNYGVT